MRRMVFLTKSSVVANSSSKVDGGLRRHCLFLSSRRGTGEVHQLRMYRKITTGPVDAFPIIVAW